MHVCGSGSACVRCMAGSFRVGPFRAGHGMAVRGGATRCLEVQRRARSAAQSRNQVFWERCSTSRVAMSSVARSGSQWPWSGRATKW